MPVYFFQQQLIGEFSFTTHPEHSPRHLGMTVECLTSLLCLVEEGRTHPSKAFSSHVPYPWMASRHTLFSWAWLVVFFLLLMVSAEIWCPFLTVQKFCRQVPNFSSDLLCHPSVCQSLGDDPFLTETSLSDTRNSGNALVF